MKQYGIFAGIVVVVAVAAFFGGTRYEKSSLSATIGAGRGQFTARTTGGAGGPGGARNAQFGQGGVASGEVLSFASGTLTLKLTDGSSRVVIMPTSATISKSVAGTTADLVAGQYVFVTGTPNSDGSVTAESVQLRPAPSPRPSPSPTAQ